VELPATLAVGRPELHAEGQTQMQLSVVLLAVALAA
jgi:hypothetical protein